MHHPVFQLFLFYALKFEDVDMTIEVIQNFEANYPELLHRIFIINGKFIFNKSSKNVNILLSTQ